VTGLALVLVEIFFWFDSLIFTLIYLYLLELEWGLLGCFGVSGPANGREDARPSPPSLWRARKAPNKRNSVRLRVPPANPPCPPKLWQRRMTSLLPISKNKARERRIRFRIPYVFGNSNIK
jgi:hypothetical protein